MEDENAKDPSADEKLSEEEFRKLLPHLELSQLFLIKIKYQEKWIKLYEPKYDDGALKSIHCSICSEDLPLKKLQGHNRDKSHLDALSKTEHIHNPLYTESIIPKSSGDLTDEEEEMQKAEEIAAEIEQEMLPAEDKASSVRGAIRMIMSVDDLLDIEVQKQKGGKWEKMLSANGPITEKGKYDCHVCDRYCVGMITVNAHLRGSAHRRMQHSVFALRSPNNERANKYTVFVYNNNFNRNEKHSRQYEKDFKHNEKSSKSDSKSNNKSDKEGLIGVEFVVKLKDGTKQGECTYACCLCNFVMIPTAELMENHLTSFNHRFRYFMKFYPDTTNRYQNMVRSIKIKNGMPFILSQVALALEEYHGYGRPYNTTLDEFMKDKKVIGDIVDGLPHAVQEFGPSFSNVVTMDDLRKFKKENTGARFVKQITKARFTTPMKGKYYLGMRHHVSRVMMQSNKNPDPRHEDRHVRRSSRSSSSRRERSYSDMNRSISRSKSPQLSQSRKRRSSPNNFEPNKGDDVWRMYRHRISKAATQLEDAYLDYRRFPERHPEYDKEWSMFWKRRKSELQLEGIDYRTFDFQPEWNTYFRHRLEQLFSEELQKSKLEVRCELNIPLDAEEDSELFQNKRSITPNYGARDIPNADLRSEKVFKPNPSIEDKKDMQMWNPSAASTDDNKPNVIHMLRLMTALEDHLGSIGGKVLELLTKALSLEKVYSVDSEQFEKRILNAPNCRLLKLAQEKLKSQIYADLVEDKKLKSFNSVIECTKVLLERAHIMGWSDVEEPSSAPANTQMAPIEKILEVLQEKKKSSLPDTLMNIITKKNNSIPMETKIFNNSFEQGNYDFDNYNRQNSTFMPQNTFATNNAYAGDNFSMSSSNFDFSGPLKQPSNDTVVWNRLGDQTNYMQRNSQDFAGGLGGTTGPFSVNTFRNNNASDERGNFRSRNEYGNFFR